MDTATLSRPGLGPRRARAGGRRRPAESSRRVSAAIGGVDPRHAGLALVLVGTLALRLWGVKQGLPYSYNVDEETHFVPKAIAFFSHDYNPRYFLNPPAFSYLLHIVLELWFGSADAVRRAYTTDPTGVFVVARVVAAALGTISVWLTYLAGSRMFSRDVGLVAAAVFGLAFLPIFYSHLALNDVPTLAPVALSLYGVAGVMRLGRLRDYAIAGLGIGLAAATKYTGGITLVCLLAAFAADAAGGRLWPSLRGLLLGLVLALAAFVIANPYSVLDFSAFRSGVSMQASLAGGEDPVKLGTTAGSGIAYYVWTFTWGLGWVPSLAAAGGAGLLIARRRIATALVLLPAPVAFVVFMGEQQRFFGRWLLPVFPIVAILCAYAVADVVRRAARGRGLGAVLIGAVAAVVLLGQSVATVLHNDRVLSRPDTRNVARAWMVAHIPVGAKVVIEPVVADDFATDIGTASAATANGARWRRFPTWVSDVDSAGRPLPPGRRRFVVVDQYERTLRPELLDEYVQGGYCWVVIGSLQAGRSFAQPRIAPSSIAYYAALANRSSLVYHASPFTTGQHSVPFSFDWSIDYYPRQYDRPGPELSIYHLTGGRCQ